MMRWNPFAKLAPITPPGLHHFAGTPALRGKRLHLRVDAGGQALLLIDASRVLHLNMTACDYIYLFLQGLAEAEILRRIRIEYSLTPEALLEKVRRFLVTRIVRSAYLRKK